MFNFYTPWKSYISPEMEHWAEISWLKLYVYKNVYNFYFLWLTEAATGGVLHETVFLKI